MCITALLGALSKLLSGCILGFVLRHSGTLVDERRPVERPLSSLRTTYKEKRRKKIPVQKRMGKCTLTEDRRGNSTCNGFDKNYLFLGTE